MEACHSKRMCATHTCELMGGWLDRKAEGVGVQQLVGTWQMGGKETGSRADGWLRRGRQVES